MSIILTCPLCESSQLVDFLDRPNVPVHQNLLMDSPDTAANVTRGDLRMASCEHCGFVFNRAFDESKLSYGEDYDNDQMHSAGFQKHIDERIHYLISDQQIKNCHIIEVGCGQGQIITRLVKEGNNTGTGFDPSYVGELSLLDGKLSFERRFYDASCSDISADVVISRHVIEHVPEPLEMLKSIRKALNNSTNAKVFFETPCVEWILENQVIWDFFYEHCSLFTASSLSTAFETAGFKVESVQHIFGGQYLWLEASVIEDEKLFHDEQNKNDITALAHRYEISETELRAQWIHTISTIKSKGGRVALWGAGAKGTTLANLIDAEGDLIDSLIDINPNKQNKYVAGSAHPIINYQQISVRGITDIVLMNPNYHDEIKQLLKESDITANLIEKPL